MVTEEIDTASRPTRPEPSPARFPIVGIGASAGGLEALEALTKHLTADGMAFVVLQHLAPGHESVLTDILARGAPLRVVTIKDGMAVEKDHIYVTPPTVEVALHQGILRLMPPSPDRRGARLSIDAFFRSLAQDCGNMAIGVILSGAGSDGSLGLKAIKEAEGITFVQDPATASQASMPQSALELGVADFSMSPAEIGDELMRLSQHPYIVARPRRLFEPDTRSKLFVLLRGMFGVDFASYKQSTIERRIQRRMLLHKLERLEDYVNYVQANPEELSLLYSDLLISVTEFFRDEEPFESLKTVVFPRLLDNRRHDQPLRIWVAGCATGEEAFSIAICLLEYLGERAAEYKIQIFATDVDEQALVKARLAVYPQSIELDVSPDRLQRFFVPADKGYQVGRVVRDMVVFARQNLGKDPPFSRMDLVSCRNVLIYMEQGLQNKVLRVFHYALNPDAFLLLGSSESVGELSDLFSLVDRSRKLYAKKNVATTTSFDFTVGRQLDVDHAKPRVVEPRPVISVLQFADRKVIEQYGPPGVVVNEAFDILQYRGKTGRFFEPTPGIATTNFLKLVRPELVQELRPAMHKAIDDGIRTLSRPIRIGHGKDASSIRLDITPLPTAPGTGKTLLVLFTEPPGEVVLEAAPAEEPLDARIEALEREVVATKEYLQTTIEELEAANEELQSSNEELQSSNEELQSTNEELQTSKEELQSTNEELVTLNEELQNRMDQLNVTHDDLQNVLGASSAALVIVGTDQRIRRFSAAAEKILSLIPSDIGRPIAYLRTVIRARDIDHTVAQAIATITSRNQRVRGVDGWWYDMSVEPYRTSDRAIRGAVIELRRSSPGEDEPRAPEIGGLAGVILTTAAEALALLDTKMCVHWANNAFLELFEVGADIINRPLEDLWSGKTEQPDLWKLLENAAIEGRLFEQLVTQPPFGEPLRAPMRFSARRVPTDDGRPVLTLVTIATTGEGVGGNR